MSCSLTSNSLQVFGGAVQQKLETCQTRLQASLCELCLQVQTGSTGVFVVVSERLTECKKVDQAPQADLPTKKIGEDKSRSSDTKKGSDRSQ